MKTRPNLFTGRHAGLLVPLFSMPSSNSWGIGEIADLEPMSRWLEEAGQDLLQLLPVNEMAEGQHSPYSAMSAMSIDPIYIAVSEVEDFSALGGLNALTRDARRALADARSAPGIQYAPVRVLKAAALRAAFDRFHDAEWRRQTARAANLAEFIRREHWWLDDHALFRALHDHAGGAPWTEWEPPLRSRDPAALDRARATLAREVLFHQFLQWTAHEQWQAARTRCDRVALLGDLPFMVSTDSADVWARQGDFRLDAWVGVPPDAFSETGQNWHLPAYHWEIIEANDFTWLRQRARRAAALYDGYRIDHVVGFFRTYVFPSDGSTPFFSPADRARQVELGSRVLQALASAGARVIAEDLGTVPRFVRTSLARLGLPGYRVLRWEREWDQPGRPFRDPTTYPALSVATSGTHDTDPLALWWETMERKERARVLEIGTLAGLSVDPASQEFPSLLRDGLLRSLFLSGSSLVVLPIQDIFGWRDRINVPASVDRANWRFRLPWPVDQLSEEPDARERAAALRRWSEESRRVFTKG